MTTKEQYLALLGRVVDADDPAEMFAALLKETYREGKRAGIHQQRENQRWETPK